MLNRSLTASLSRSRRSVTSLFFWETSIGLETGQSAFSSAGRFGAYLASPNGFDLAAVDDDAGLILGDDIGLGLDESFPERGSSSNLRRPICGVGGVDVVAKRILLIVGLVVVSR